MAHYDFTGNTNDYAAPPGGLTYVDGNLRLFVTAFIYTNDNPLTPTPVPGSSPTSQIGVVQKNTGLGACNVFKVNNCNSETLLDGKEDAELLLFQFFDNTTGDAVAVSISTVDFNNTNGTANGGGENFDAWEAPLVATVIDDALVSHNSGVAGINGNTLVNLGPTTAFALGIDNCFGNPLITTTVGCGNTDQVRIGNFMYSYEDGIVSGEVPLPAAAWLLLGGIGALGAASRRRRAS